MRLLIGISTCSEISCSDSDNADNSKSGNEAPEDKKSINHDTVQQNKVTEPDDNHTTNSDKSISGSNQAEVCMNRDFGFGSIVAFAKSLNGHGVTCGGMTGKKNKTVLGLKTTP